MRAGVAAFWVVALMMTVPLPVMGQGGSGAAGIEVLQDEAGDIDAQAGSASAGNPSGYYDYLDITTAWVDEAEETFTFTVQVVDLNYKVDSQTDDGGNIRLYFTHSDAEFVVDFGRCGACLRPDGFFWVNLYTREVGSQEWSWVRYADFQGDLLVDYGAHTLSWTLPRDDLRDRQGAVPTVGRTLGAFYAESQYFTDRLYVNDPNGEPLAESPYAVVDLAPEEGVSDVQVPVRFGLAQDGAAFLATDLPFRASNGEAVTFLYEVDATNRDDDPGIFVFETEQVPANWEITLPVSDASLGPGETIQVPVLVHTPFSHQHGGTDSMILKMKDIDDPGHPGQVELGIHYLDTPQPAGHHDTVFFHARNGDDSPAASTFGAGPGLYMNTDQDDEGDAGIPVVAYNAGFGALNSNGNAVTAYYRWFIPLDPSLRLGLDLDKSRVGDLVVPISTTEPLGNAHLYGTLALLGPEDFSRTWTYPWGFRDATPLAEFSSTEPVEFGPNDEHTFEVPLPWLEDVERFPPAPGQNLALHIVLEAQTAQTFVTDDAINPTLLPGGKMQLPLFEYSDVVEATFSGGAGPSLRIIEGPSRQANPGDMVLFTAKIHDRSDGKATYDLSVAGGNKDWVDLLQGTTVTTDDEGDAEIPLKITVPPSALDGERADVFLEAVSREDSSRRGLVRMVVEVDTDSEHRDDAEALAALEEGQKEAPTPGLVPALVGIAVAVLIRRRR